MVDIKQSNKDQVSHIAQNTHWKYALFSSWKYTDASITLSDINWGWNDTKTVIDLINLIKSYQSMPTKNPAIFCSWNDC